MAGSPEARKELYEKYGISPGVHDYLAGAGLPDLVRKMVEEPDSDLAKVLRELDPDSLLGLARTVDLSKMDQLLAEWDRNENNDNEEFWQDLLNSALVGLTGPVAEDGSRAGRARRVVRRSGSGRSNT